MRTELLQFGNLRIVNCESRLKFVAFESSVRIRYKPLSKRFARVVLGGSETHGGVVTYVHPHPHEIERFPHVWHCMHGASGVSLSEEYSVLAEVPVKRNCLFN